ncbi:MAG: hypothetical protein NT028_11460 [candidate division Zixibacteria bacterium]|nr:hypothetical protein [candidate division Zixibacteria bacterium]
MTLYRNFFLLLLSLFVMLLCYLFFIEPSAPDVAGKLNVRVSEDSCDLVRQGMSQEQVYSVLGNPGSTSTGRVVHVERVRDPDLMYRIQETPEATDPLFIYYGVNDENIKVLFSSGVVAAVEFCFGNYTVLYRGKSSTIDGSQWVAASWHAVPDPKLQAKIDAFREKLAARKRAAESFRAPKPPPPIHQADSVVDVGTVPVEIFKQKKEKPVEITHSVPPKVESERPPISAPLVQFVSLLLPSGSALWESDLEPAAGWQNSFSSGNTIVDLHPNKALSVAACVKSTKLEGAVASFGPDGSLRCIANYHNNLLNGKLRVFKDGGRLYYGEYVDGQRDGISCYFQSNSPTLLEESSGGKLKTQYLVQFINGNPVLTAKPDLALFQGQTFAEVLRQKAILDQTLQSGEIQLKENVANIVMANTAYKNQMRINRADHSRAQNRLNQEAEFRVFWNSVLGGVRFVDGRVYVVPAGKRYYKW